MTVDRIPEYFEFPTTVFRERAWAKTQKYWGMAANVLMYS